MGGHALTAPDMADTRVLRRMAATLDHRALLRWSNGTPRIEVRSPHCRNLDRLAQAYGGTVRRNMRAFREIYLGGSVVEKKRGAVNFSVASNDGRGV